MQLMVLLLSAVFGLIGSFALAHIALRAAFRLRPLASDTQQTFFHASTIGALVTVPPMFLTGFAIFSMLFENVSIGSLTLGGEHQRLFAGLLLLGLLAQCFFRQRLSLVSQTGQAAHKRLIVDRPLFGSTCELATAGMDSIELYAPAIHPRAKRIQINCKDGTTT